MKKVLFRLCCFCFIVFNFISCTKVKSSGNNIDRNIGDKVASAEAENKNEQNINDKSSIELKESDDDPLFSKAYSDFFNYNFNTETSDDENFCSEDLKFIKRDRFFAELYSKSIDELINNYDFDFYAYFEGRDSKREFKIWKKNESWHCDSYIYKKASYFVSSEIENNNLVVTFGITDEHNYNCLNGNYAYKEYIHGLEVNFPYYTEYDFPLVYKLTLSKESLANIIADREFQVETSNFCFKIDSTNIIDTVCNGVVVSDKLNLCEKPNEDSETDKKLTKWDKVKIVGATLNLSTLEEGITGDPYPWYEVVLGDGSSGWAFGDFVRIIVKDDDVERLRNSFEPFIPGVQKKGVSYDGKKVPIFNKGILYSGDDSDYPYLINIDSFLNWYSDDELQMVEHLKISDYSPGFYTRTTPRAENNNPITSLKGIERLVNLKSINLSDCIPGLAFVPEIEQLKNIEEIDFSRQFISSLKDIGGSKTLKILKLNHTNLTDLKGIENFPALEELYISYNNLTDITDIVKLKNIKLICIDGSEEKLNKKSVNLLKKIKDRRPDIEFYIDPY